MAIKAPVKNTLLSQDSSDLNLTEALTEASDYIKSLSLDSIDSEILLLSCLLISSISQKDIVEATNLAEYLISILAPKQYLFFRRPSNSELSDTALSKERWGLDPNLITIEH